MKDRNQEPWVHKVNEIIHLKLNAKNPSIRAGFIFEFRDSYNTVMKLKARLS